MPVLARVVSKLLIALPEMLGLHSHPFAADEAKETYFFIVTVMWGMMT